MTSKFSIENRELLQRISSGEAVVGIDFGNLIVRELAAFRMAAMDSEPVACGNGCNKSKWHNIVLDIDEYINGQDARESKGRDEIYSEIILRLTRLDVLETILRNEIGLPYGSPIPDIAEKIYDIKRARIYSVVPDDLSIFEAAIEECKKCDSIDEHAWNHGVLAVIAEYESCRAAMLQASNSPAQSDCCPAQNHVSPEQNSVAPAQGGNSLVIPDEMTPEEAHEIGYYYGDPVDVFARGANWMRQHIIDSTLAAAPLEVKP